MKHLLILFSAFVILHSSFAAEQRLPNIVFLFAHDFG
jgi:hypothetical protein